MNIYIKYWNKNHDFHAGKLENNRKLNLPTIHLRRKEKKKYPWPVLRWRWGRWLNYDPLFILFNNTCNKMQKIVVHKLGIHEKGSHQAGIPILKCDDYGGKSSGSILRRNAPKNVEICYGKVSAVVPRERGRRWYSLFRNLARERKYMMQDLMMPRTTFIRIFYSIFQILGRAKVNFHEIIT